MAHIDLKKHWEHIYQTKSPTEVSWYQSTPETSLNFFKSFNIPKSAKIIDVGGGESFLVDHLLEMGYTNITVLDISANALERTKLRLGSKADSVTLIVANIASFNSYQTYDVWHDRAAFHFLTQKDDIKGYVQNAANHINTSGLLLLGSFSEDGPTKCSGISIQQYSEETMTAVFEKQFNKIECFQTSHETPSKSIQNFTFCSFRRK